MAYENLIVFPIFEVFPDECCFVPFLSFCYLMLLAMDCSGLSF